MRFVRYEKDWRGHWGILDGDAVYELLGEVFEDPRPGDRVGALDELTLLAPCTPETIWSNGANYPSRCDERGFDYPTVPAVAVVSGTSIRGTGVGVQYIFGYTGLNNIWVKDVGEKQAYTRPLRVYDNHCPTGLILDTEADWRNQPVRLWVDGEPRQDDTTSTTVFTPQLLVAFVSKQVTLKQGNVLMTGSPGGIEGTWLRFGQTVEMEILTLGRIRNPIVRADNAAVSYVISLEKWVEQQQSQKELVPTSF